MNEIRPWHLLVVGAVFGALGGVIAAMAASSEEGTTGPLLVLSWAVLSLAGAVFWTGMMSLAVAIGVRSANRS